MITRRERFRGCLLGMAVGDAMGYPVDQKDWQQIKEDYGPNGLRGYDLVNGYADVTSYTQIGAFTANGLLFGLTRGQTQGQMAPFINYVNLAGREWAASQRPWGRPQRSYCWLLRREEICRRNCMDRKMLETLSAERMGTIETPVNNESGPEGLTAAIGVGLIYEKNRISQEEMDRLGAEAVALTHGSPTAFLTGAALSHIISRLTADPRLPLAKVFREAADAVTEQFGHQYSQAFDFAKLIHNAIKYAQYPQIRPVEILEKIRCDNGARVLAGAIYACLVSRGDFDTALIAAVNHSGRSAAVGAITGAIMGLKLGERALPEFYLEGLEPAEILRELADDLYTGCPLEKGSRLFDLDWEYKYISGGQ